VGGGGDVCGQHPKEKRVDHRVGRPKNLNKGFRKKRGIGAEANGGKKRGRERERTLGHQEKARADS